MNRREFIQNCAIMPLGIFYQPEPRQSLIPTILRNDIIMFSSYFVKDILRFDFYDRIVFLSKGYRTGLVLSKPVTNFNIPYRDKHYKNISLNDWKKEIDLLRKKYMYMIASDNDFYEVWEITEKYSNVK